MAQKAEQCFSKTSICALWGRNIVPKMFGSVKTLVATDAFDDQHIPNPQQKPFKLHAVVGQHGTHRQNCSWYCPASPAMQQAPYSSHIRRDPCWGRGLCRKAKSQRALGSGKGKCTSCPLQHSQCRVLRFSLRLFQQCPSLKETEISLLKETEISLFLLFRET